MLEDKEARCWVGDQLMNFLGYNNPTTIAFVIALAKKTRKLEVLISELRYFGFPMSQDTEVFVHELLRRFSHTTSTLNAYPKVANESIVSIRKHHHSKVVDNDGDDNKCVSKVASKQRQRNDKEEDHRRERHIRRKHEHDTNNGEEVIDIKKHWTVRTPPTFGDDQETRRETSRQQDQREKEELEDRLREKDVAPSKKTNEFELSKNQKREAKRRSVAQEQKELLPNLRQISREEYLKKRGAKKLQELEDELLDEEFLFGGMKLTTKEQKENRCKKKIYQLGKQLTKGVGEAIGYHMPETYNNAHEVKHDKRFFVALNHYKDVEDEERASNQVQQQIWEKTQANRSTLKFGATNKEEVSHHYEYLLEDQVDFIQANTMGGHWVDEDAQAINNARFLTAKTARQKLLEDQKCLPIYEYREQLLNAIKEHQILVIEGETGSGKTTQITQYLHEAGYTKHGKIGCTQPRRVAAMSVAVRVATEMGVKLGHEVGFSVRFENCTSNRTVIKYMTDGMLLREFLGEPDLASYSVIIIDEAHERTVNTDILFGLVKDITRYRPDIKLLISSATLDAQKFCDFFDGAPLFRIPGRRFPIDILYTKAPEADYVEATTVTVLQIHVTQPPGDVLVFLPGQEDIEIVAEKLEHQMRGHGSKVGEMIVHQIYANLPSDIQAKIFEKTAKGARKVVLATNIAETSLTIDGIKYVIDIGLCKQKCYNPQTDVESLIVTPISQAAANQRAGRAGRTSAGKCLRLYTAWSFQNEMDENTIPEIQRTNLDNVVLLLKSLGINDLVNFDFIDPPPVETLLRALEKLYALGALNSHGELTKMGRQMAEFPVDPMLSKMLVASDNYKCSKEIVTICAMLSLGNSVFYRPKDRQTHADVAHMQFHTGNVGDHIALLKVYNSWEGMNYSSQWCYENYIQERRLKQARDIRDQLEGLLERVEIKLSSNPNKFDNIKKAITSGFFYHTAKLKKDGLYHAIKNPQTMRIHPSSGLFHALQLPQLSCLKEAKWVVYHQLVMTDKEYMRQVIEIKPNWLVEIAPHYYGLKVVQLSKDPQNAHINWNI